MIIIALFIAHPAIIEKQGIGEFVFQLLLYDFLIFQIPLAALYDLGMQEQIVRHYYCAEHAHDHEHRPLRKSRDHPSFQGAAPADISRHYFYQKRDPDQGNEPYDDLFDFL